jgi:hypothetical protein
MYLHYRLHQTSITHSYRSNYLNKHLHPLNVLEKFYKSIGSYTAEIQTRLNWACLHFTTKAVKFERIHDVSADEKAKIIDGILSDQRVRNAIMQVGDEIGEQLLGERYDFMRDKRSLELLNAPHL